MSSVKVQVLLACYQGERYLRDQLDSLLNQSYNDFTILARDDGSTDQTLSILEDYARRFPNKLEIIRISGRLGVIGNFNALLEASTADYIFFADQDDVWEPSKILVSLNAMQETGLPLLLHTDLKIVDRDLHQLHDSFWSYSQFDPDKGNALNRLLVQNVVTGCTMGINKELKDLATPIPKEAIMHDWWLALVAACVGKVIALPEKTIMYRQHEDNVLGANRVSWKSGLQKLFVFILNPETNTQNAVQKHNQAKVLYERFKKIAPKCKLELLETFLKAPELSWMSRKWYYLSHQFYRQGLKKVIPYIFQNRPF
jgi:glycosyltransferase involved in cell wall biosynthesis